MTSAFPILCHSFQIYLLTLKQLVHEMILYTENLLEIQPVGPPTITLFMVSLSFFLFFSFCCSCFIWNFSGWGSNLSHSSDLGRCSYNARFLFFSSSKFAYLFILMIFIFSIVAVLQCSGNFYCTAKWPTHIYILFLTLSSHHVPS